MNNPPSDETMSSTESQGKSPAAPSSESKSKTKDSLIPDASKSKSLLSHLICHVIPLYLIIGSIILIALPSSSNISQWIFPPPKAEAEKKDVGKKDLPLQPQNNQQDVSRAAISSPAEYSANGNSEEAKASQLIKIALDASKERLDMMKENYEKIFSFIAAFAALLAFLGFKGLETFTQTKNNALDAERQARIAAEEAAQAKEQAKNAVKELHDFMENQYKIDNSAEINVAHGIILREIAGLHKSLTDQNILECRDKHRTYLKQSLYYLDLATENKSTVSRRILSRAYVTKGNVHNLLGNYSKAFEATQEALLVNKDDHSALFNAACYCAKIAEDFDKHNDYIEAERFVALALRNLKASIDLNESYADLLPTETDFTFIRKNPTFKTIGKIQ